MRKCCLFLETKLAIHWATAKSINQNVLKLKYPDILASNSTTELKHRELDEKINIQKSYIFNKEQNTSQNL